MTESSKVLISSSAKKTIKESVELAKELGLGIEISRVPLYKNENLTVKDTVEILKNDLLDFSDRVTLHAMFSDVNVAGGDVLLKKSSQLRVLQSFEIGQGIGADTILFHTGNKGTKHYGSINNFKKNFIAFWKDFINEFENTGKIAVIENVFEDTPEFCIELFEGVNSSNFKLALDTGHVNLYAPETKVTDWIKLYGQNLYHLHIHNNFQKNDDHSNLENGTLNFKEIFDEVKKQNINPSFVFEMFTEEDIRKSFEIFKKQY